MESKYSQKIAVLVEDQYQVLEVWYPILRLKEEGFKAVSLGTGQKNSYKSKEGYEINVDSSIDEVDAKDFSAVVIPGGYAPDILRRYPKVINFVQDLFNSGKVVASICHGGWVLASADILKGKTATCFFAIKDDIIHAGAKYIDKEVVVDANLITSRKPEDLPAFLKEIIKALKK
ncbi:MAG: type 1 glutamine amidotransferase domain-containing protein [Candidatus Omnitrophota bacterium]|nr:type 1 glutamine amidotransferase domain-containing protein [Candidatus Omnitrophota bacterium]